MIEPTIGKENYWYTIDKKDPDWRELLNDVMNSLDWDKYNLIIDVVEEKVDEPKI